MFVAYLVEKTSVRLGKVIGGFTEADGTLRLVDSLTTINHHERLLNAPIRLALGNLYLMNTFCELPMVQIECLRIVHPLVSFT